MTSYVRKTRKEFTLVVCFEKQLPCKRFNTENFLFNDKKEGVFMKKRKITLIIALIALLVAVGSVYAASRCNPCGGMGTKNCSTCNGATVLRYRDYSGKWVNQTCPSCNGRGRVTCYSCNGRGYNNY